ncbi:MAG: hypothetical protein J6X80_04115 [Lachnospiraceae bacterium]|nr:hypothetical protein [Lachnospiraceae bacterium]
MSKEDEMIKEALKLDVNASDELNRKIIENVGKKKSNVYILRVAAIAASFFAIVLGTGIIANAATDNGIIEYVKGVIDNRFYVFGNGSNTEATFVDIAGKNVQQVDFKDDEVVFYNPVEDGETEYSLYLKVKSDDMDDFILLSASVDEGASTEELYYTIKGSFWYMLKDFKDANKKAQIIDGLREAANNADIDAVKRALNDLADEYEGNKRIFYFNFPAEIYNASERTIVYEDITDLPAGDSAIIVNTVNDELTFIFEISISDNENLIDFNLGNLYSDEYYQELADKNLPIYDLR